MISTAPFQNEKGYLDLMELIWKEGDLKSNRTGIDTKSIISNHCSYDLSGGKIPLLTTKKIPVKSLLVELEWFIRGDNNIKFLIQNNCKIWDEWPFMNWLEKTDQKVPKQNSEEWKSKMEEFKGLILNDQDFAEKWGSIGDGAYGKMWRAFPGPNGKIKDQLKAAVEKIKTNPNDRRIIVNAFHPTEADNTFLPPCHSLCQFGVTKNKELICTLYQRSADYFLGVPFNIASYSILTHYIAKITGLKAVRFDHFMFDTHLYVNHEEAVMEQLGRKNNIKESPILILPDNLKNLEDFNFKTIQKSIQNYDPMDSIKAQVAI